MHKADEVYLVRKRFENNKVEKSILTATKSEMSIENEGGLALRHPVVV